MANNIPAGYQLAVTTWENDGDANLTKYLYGLSEDDVRFYIDLAQRFSSCNNHKNRGLGNDGVRSEVLAELFSEVLTKHQNISLGLKNDLIECIEHDTEDDEGSWCYEFLTDKLLGYPVDEFYSYEYENFCRVFSGFEVHYIPSEIIDVTEQFK